MVVRGCDGDCAQAIVAPPTKMTAVKMTDSPHHGFLPSPLWGRVGGGGSAMICRWRHWRLAAPPPSPTLPHKGGGNRPSLGRDTDHHIRRHPLIIDHHAPGNPADRHR